MIIAIDTETGGLKPGKSALLSISACQYDDPTKNFTTYIQPDPSLEISPEAALVNGYTVESWKDRGAVPLIEALRRFKAWLPFSNNSPLAHNAHFDKNFIEAAEEQSGFKTFLQYRWRCSMSTFMFANDILHLKADNFKLETLARMCGHWKTDFNRGSHQSIDDVLACAAGYKWLYDRIQKPILENADLTSRVLMLEAALNSKDEILTKVTSALSELRAQTDTTYGGTNPGPVVVDEFAEIW